MSLPSVLPSGPGGDALLRLAQMIAGGARFQSETKSEDANAALDCVSYPHLRDGQAFSRPIAVLKLTDGGLQYYRVAGGDRNYFCVRGSFELMLGRPFINAADSRDEELDFLNYAEAVIADLQEASGANDNLNIVDVNMTMAPARSDPRQVVAVAGDEPPFYAAKFKIDWDQV